MKKYIFCLGFFDGVHLGHQALLRRCVAMAAESGLGTAALTFDRHPKSLFTDQPTVLISTIPDRELLLRRYGMEKIYILPVTRENMAQPWREFVNMLLRAGAAGFVCGDDFRFGNRGEGCAQNLSQLCRELGLPCVVIPEQTVGGIRVSSTHIRRRIEAGDMAQAVAFMGHPYTLTGTVIRGQQPGGKLGIPAAHLLLPEGLAIPKFGVYACSVWLDGRRCPAVANIGAGHTLEGQGVIVEPWILDCDEELRGREITLEIYRFLRSEWTNPSVEELREEILRNAAETRAILHGECE